MTILDNNHPRKKPLDFGQYGITGSVDYRNGGLIALNSYHPEHGYITLTSAAPFPDDQRYDQAAVRRYRASLATLPGFGYQVDQPIMNTVVELLEDAIPKVRFEYANGGNMEITTFATPFGAVQEIKLQDVTAQWGGKLCLMRCAYTQLTEGGVIPAPPVQMQITFEDGLLTIYSPSLQWAVAVSGFPKGENWTLEADDLVHLPLPDSSQSVTLTYGFGESLKAARVRAKVDPNWDVNQVSTQLEIYKKYWQRLPDDFLLRRAIVYALSMVVPTGEETSAILTDHMLLPLSWNRDAYYIALALLSAGIHEPVERHLKWMFEQAERVNGFWGRCYVANGKVKDAAFQLDQQIYPLTEFIDYIFSKGTNYGKTVKRFEKRVEQLLQNIDLLQHSEKILFPTTETPGDDPLDLPYHLSSHALMLATYLYLPSAFHDSEFSIFYRSVPDQLSRRFTPFIGESANKQQLYSYSTDGNGNHDFYHDANDLPLITAALRCPIVFPIDDMIWQATIRFAFSSENRGYFGGRLGSVHTPAPWPLGDMQEWLIAQIQGDWKKNEEIKARFSEIAQWDGTFPEAYNLEDGSVVSRHWFAWPAAVYACIRLCAFLPFWSREEMLPILTRIYGDEKAAELLTHITAQYRGNPYQPTDESYFSEKTVTLITYGDSINTPDEAPLKTLHRFLNKHVKGVIDTIHILPFYPFSSDDGFSVIDYYAVNPELGDWSDIEALKANFRLMFDAVINHMSAESEWFRRFLAGDPDCAGLFFTESPETDLSMVTRPRTTPLLTPFTTPNGETLHLWTTFSADQIDLDYRSPQTLLRILDTLLFYIQKGATVLRLDAIAYMWKQAGTTSIHLPQTHAIIQFLRAMLPRDVILITETNVPHAENISYFGHGLGEEAQLVYNFTLPPLLLNTIYQGNASKLADWINTLELPGHETAFFNFTASHDGIGVRPVEGILTREELDALIAGVEARNGRVSYKNNPDGSRSPYELNITYVDAVSAPGQPDEVNVQRFLLSQAVLLALAGVPAIYIHSLLGSHNDLEGMAQTGRNRTINRARLDLQTLEAELAQPESFRARVFNGLQHLIKVRTAQPAFSPRASQHAQIVHDGRVLILERSTSDDPQQTIRCVFNFSSDAQKISEISGQHDLLTGSMVDESLPPYAVRWLRMA